MKRTPLTQEEHQQLGAELKAIRSRLQEIWTDLSTRYGRGKQTYRYSARAVDALDHLRCELDSIVFQDHPIPPGTDYETERKRRINYYYGSENL